MKISILTLFPEMFEGPFAHSIMKRAQEKGLLNIEFINIRDFGEGKHKMVDDTAYGGGVGMVMKVDVVHKAIEFAKNNFNPQGANTNSPLGWQVIEYAKRHSGSVQNLKIDRQDDVRDSGRARMTKVILLSASGKLFKQQIAQEYSKLDHLILICGHYEGIDDRIRHYIDEEISIGDFVLTGGELPSMLIADSVVRLIPGVLPEGATEDESFAEVENQTLLEYPHYTSPRTYDGHDVPEVLLNGNHKKIGEWRRNEAKKKTKTNRPDLLASEDKIQNSK